MTFRYLEACIDFTLVGGRGGHLPKAVQIYLIYQWTTTCMAQNPKV